MLWRLFSAWGLPPRTVAGGRARLHTPAGPRVLVIAVSTNPLQVCTWGPARASHMCEGDTQGCHLTEPTG